MTIAQGFIPGANCSGCGGNAKNNYSYTSTNTLTANQQTYRVDEDMHKWGRLFGRGTYSTYDPFGAGGASAAASGSGTSGINTNWAAGHTINIGSHIVNQFIMGEMDSYLVNFGAPVARLGSNGARFQRRIHRSHTTAAFLSHDRLWKSEWRAI